MPEKVTAAQMLGYLRMRYGGRNDAGYEWAFLTEVPSGTGSSYRRSADAIAMNLWPSRGLAMHGFEIKVARGDWLRELKAPEKADPFIRFMDRWWIVAPQDIVKPGELPEGWGLLELRGRRLYCKTEAPKLEAEPVSRQFLAALLRASVVAPTAESGLRRAAYDEGYQSGVDHGNRQMRMVERERDSLMELITTFSKTTGIHMRTWGEVGAEARKLGEQVNVVMDGDRQLDHLLGRLKRVSGEAKNLAEAALRASEALSEGDES